MANSQNSRLQEQKYTEAEYIFQTIEMANEETSAANSELDLADYFSWKVVKRRQKPQRRYTVSHGAPPAPPSTPTSLSKEHDPLLSPSILSTSPTSTDTNINGETANITDDSERFNKLLYTIDYTPKYKKKLKEQDRTSTELAELFKVVTITGGSGREPKTKLSPEHGVSFQSRRIRRRGDTFMIHRNPIEHTHEMFDEDSLSAPEFEGISSDEFKESTVTRRRSWRFFNRKPKSRLRTGGRKLIAKHFELMEHMDEIADSFDTAMSFRPAHK